MKGTLPRANVGRFAFDGSDFKFVAFEKEDSSNKPTSYKATCFGDSGSGHWVTVDEENLSSVKEENTRRALVAVANNGGLGEYDLGGFGGSNDEELIQGVCGGSMPQWHYLIYAASCVKTNNEEILGFIKKLAGICRKNSLGNCIAL